MRVLCYNTCALPGLSGDIGERLRRACAAIVAMKPDLILLQEVFLRRHLRLLSSHLSDWPHRFSGRRSVMRFCGGLAVFSRFPILSAAFAPFREQGSWLRFSALARLSKKGAMTLLIEGPRHRAIQLLLTHLVADYRRPGRHAADRRADPYSRFQAGQMSELAGRILGLDAQAPLLVCGDLNLLPDSPLLLDLMARTGLRDSMAGRRSASMIGRPFYRVPFDPTPCKRLDYVLFKPGEAGWPSKAKARYALREPARLLSRRVTTLSDHYGLLVELR
ncbi:MAG: endonuclease/exonuclease/phosphatase family protein [Elusimicrobiota bacterium]